MNTAVISKKQTSDLKIKLGGFESLNENLFNSLSRVLRLRTQKMMLIKDGQEYRKDYYIQVFFFIRFCRSGVCDVVQLYEWSLFQLVCYLGSSIRFFVMFCYSAMWLKSIGYGTRK